jgi:hypothetical protein
LEAAGSSISLFVSYLIRPVEICLVNIVHPPEVKEQIAGLENVTLVEDDVTGGLVKEVWQKARRRLFLNRLRSADSIQGKSNIDLI